MVGPISQRTPAQDESVPNRQKEPNCNGNCIDVAHDDANHLSQRVFCITVGTGGGLQASGVGDDRSELAAAVDPSTYVAEAKSKHFRIFLGPVTI